MIQNFLKVALRNLMKRKEYSLINILGLATGMAVCLLIVLFVQSELDYDEYHKNGNSVYRIALERKYPAHSSSYAIVPYSISDAVEKEFPEVLESTRIFNFGGGNGNFFMRVGDKTFEEKKVLAVDSNFFRVFTGEFLYGDPATALQNPNAVVLSEHAAIKIYGSAQQAIGKQFQADFDENNNFLITGICKDWPGNSHFTFDVLLSASTFPQQPNYVNFSVHTYLLLSPGADVSSLEGKFPAIVNKYVAGEIGRLFGQSFQDFTAAGNGYHYYLQPLRKIHLTSDLEGEFSPNGSMQSVYIFSVIAVFILFLACINFINLSTARSVERAKEVGIRKTFGSEKKALILQFLVESVLVSLMALIIALGLMFALIPLFNQLSGKSLTILYFIQPLRLLMIIAFAFIVGIIAGLYPAFVLSSFKPIMVLKGRFKSNKYGLALRNGLVIFQFAISVILIISAIIVNQQMKYMLGGKLGFNKDYIITIERADLLDNQMTAFKTEAARLAGVESVSGTSTVPGAGNFFGATFQSEQSAEPLTGRGLIVDEDFDKTLGIELKQGRFFSKAFGTDSLSLVLNEKAVQELGIKNPIGARLTTPDVFFNAPDGSNYTYTIVGVVKDFHFQSLHQKIVPLFLANSSKFLVNNIIAVRIKGDNFQAAINGLEQTWKKFVQDRPFHYSFLDQTLEAQYVSEKTIQKIFTTFSSLAIFIACIGLLGLIAYTTQQRTREISIRKILGASADNIVKLLSKDFLKLIAIAAIIGFPIAWWAMHTWLQDFAYRVGISWWVFVAAGIAALLIALLTISFQAIKAAVANPVNSLRAE